MIKVTLTKRFNIWKKKIPYLTHRFWEAMVCTDKLNEYFYIPKDIKKIDLILSETKTSSSHKIKIIKSNCFNYRVRFVDFGSINELYYNAYLYMNGKGLVGKTLYLSVEY